MAEGLRGPLTLVTAPAGFGKTTLVASCLATCGMPVAWLSLDRDDNLPGRFVGYLAAALQEACPGVGTEAAELAAAQAPAQTVLASLVNDLDSSRRDLALVLDDAQFISNPAVHESVAFLLEHCPPTLHIVIATRSDPPLPLARLRAHGQLLELRAADLSFTEEETAQFLNDAMELRLDARSVTALRERTEGWIAGLQMAALSMRDRTDVQGFIEGFSGTNRYILDYLIEEVLVGQPAHVQDFLLRTSVLERLSAPLCDALLKDEGGAPSGTRGAGMKDEVRAETARDFILPLGTLSSSSFILESLERSNLFLVSLDDERHWFRYHHLFAELLRTRLEHLHPAAVPELHLRASAWYEGHGLMEEAVSHALQAREVEQAGRLINRLTAGMIAGSLTFKLSHWINQLPDSYVRTQPWMCIALAWAYGYQGLMPEQADYLDEAERHLSADDPPAVQREMRGHILALRSLAASTNGDFGATIRLNQEALKLIAPDNAVVRVTVGYNLGRTYLTLGDLAQAEATLWDTVRLCMQAGVHHILAPTITTISRLYRLQGRLRKTVEAIRPLQTYIEEHNPKAIHAAPYVYIGNLDALRERNRLEEAEELARRMLADLEPWKSQNCTCATATALARVLRAEGKLEEACELLRFASSVIERYVPFGDIRSGFNAAWVGYWLANDGLSMAEDWLEEWRKTRDAGAGQGFTTIEEQNEITACRVLMAKGHRKEAAQRLARLAQFAEAGGRNGRLIEIDLLLAESLHGQGNVPEAMHVLGKSLALAEPEGYVRVFLDEGEPARVLLALWLAHTSTGPGFRREYAARVLAQFDGQPQEAPTTMPREPTLAPEGGQRALAEPLTGREMEVLYLMAQGRTNIEIAEQLVISPGTVKAHAAHIYGKLDATNRTEAVARARQVGILE